MGKQALHIPRSMKIIGTRLLDRK